MRMKKITHYERLPFIDFGKTIGILLVTFIHIANKSNAFTKWASLYKLVIF